MQQEDYGWAAQLYLMALDLENTVVDEVTKAGVGGALFSIGIYDGLRDEIIEKFGLNSDDPYRTH